MRPRVRLLCHCVTITRQPLLSVRLCDCLDNVLLVGREGLRKQVASGVERCNFGSEAQLRRCRMFISFLQGVHSMCS